MARVTNSWRKHCRCRHGCPTYAEITEWSCGCVEVEIYREKSAGWDCTDFSGMRRRCDRPGSRELHNEGQWSDDEAPRKPSSDDADDEGMPLVLTLLFGFFVLVFSVPFLFIRWILRRPWRVVVALVVAAGIALSFWQSEYQQGATLGESAGSIAQSAPTAQPVPPIEQPVPATAQPMSPDSGIRSLGIFSDGYYQLELWRDESASGQVIGRIFLIPEDASKSVVIRELNGVAGDGISGPFSFTSTLPGEEISFEGIVIGDSIEGTLRSTFSMESRQAGFRRLENQDQENYETRRSWAERTAELLACCGPSPSPAVSGDQQNVDLSSDPAVELAAPVGDVIDTAIGFIVTGNDVPVFSDLNGSGVTTKLPQGTLAANAKGMYLDPSWAYELEEANGRTHIVYLRNGKIRAGWVASEVLQHFSYDCACAPACDPILRTAQAEWNACFQKAHQDQSAGKGDS